MVEFTLPALYTGNRSKLGEVLFDEQFAGQGTLIELVAGVRLPGLMLLRDPAGKLTLHAVGIQSHSSVYRRRPHGHEW
jgi:hypothetical protein